MTLDALVRNPLTWGVVLFAFGVWLLLPRRSGQGWWLGFILTLVSFGLFASRMPVVGDWASTGTFALLAAVTVIAAALTVTLRNPIYCALWFALSLLGTAGLFMLQGAQFLGVATVVVYAGAILVTFLFVLMLANPEGHAYYDRLSWEAPLSAITGALMVGVLTFTFVGVFSPKDETYAQIKEVDADRSAEILASEHMAHLGGQLFSRHLIAVELAGTLLLVALVGCVAIVAEAKVRREGKGRLGNRAGRAGGAR
jgi:NADH-quinone oxidoreductase subunit J